MNFSYKHGSGKNALTDIDLHIKSGETIGVIGGTGSGKSSLVNLICRLYDVMKVPSVWAGVDVRRYDTEVLRDQVSVVLQKNTLFSGTILDNLRWGNPKATKEECIEACKAACADEFIDRMPKGYETWIERGGSNVSGGQKQRLCIARALLKKPKVLILDDSTSAVDTVHDAVSGRPSPGRSPGPPRSSSPSVSPACSLRTGSWCWTTDGSTTLIPMRTCWNTTPSTRRSSIRRSRAAATLTSRHREGRRRTDL